MPRRSIPDPQPVCGASRPRSFYSRTRNILVDLQHGLLAGWNEERMGKRERYEPGTFCRVDVATTDPAGARIFYSALFGWEAELIEAGGKLV